MGLTVDVSLKVTGLPSQIGDDIPNLATGMSVTVTNVKIVSLKQPGVVIVANRTLYVFSNISGVIRNFQMGCVLAV